MIENYERSRYLRLEDEDGFVAYINMEKLKTDGDIVEVFMKRFLGAPDFRTNGLSARTYYANENYLDGAASV